MPGNYINEELAGVMKTRSFKMCDTDGTSFDYTPPADERKETVQTKSKIKNNPWVKICAGEPAPIKRRKTAHSPYELE